MSETQKTIAEWANTTLGVVTNPIGSVTRAMKEMAELAMCVANDPNDPKAVEEAADVVICLARFGEANDVDLLVEGERKMRTYGEYAPRDPIKHQAIAALRLADVQYALLPNSRTQGSATLRAVQTVGLLYLFANHRGEDLNVAIDAKMAINRRREWRLDGHGHGYHIDRLTSAALANHRADEFARALDQEP